MADELLCYVATRQQQWTTSVQFVPKCSGWRSEHDLLLGAGSITTRNRNSSRISSRTGLAFGGKDRLALRSVLSRQKNRLTDVLLRAQRVARVGTWSEEHWRSHYYPPQNSLCIRRGRAPFGSRPALSRQGSGLSSAITVTHA